jgi:hypothetical protein
MARHEITDILALERKVWDALVSGDAVADQNMLSDDFLGVYKSGFATRQEHAGQLAQGPTIETYELADASLKVLCDNVVLLAYLANYIRPGAGRSSRMYVSSIWQLTDGIWRNIFSQDTDAE